MAIGQSGCGQYARRDGDTNEDMFIWQRERERILVVPARFVSTWSSKNMFPSLFHY
jgi:hypothetical protein